MTVYRFRHSYLLLEPTATTLGCIRVFFALMDRCTIGEAIRRAMTNVPNFDLTECFSVLLSADVAVALQLTTRCHSYQRYIQSSFERALN